MKIGKNIKKIKILYKYKINKKNYKNIRYEETIKNHNFENDNICEYFLSKQPEDNEEIIEKNLDFWRSIEKMEKNIEEIIETKKY